MLKFLIISAVIVGALIIGGVLEVTVHTDQFAQVPSRILSFASNKATVEKVRTMAVKLKRQGEQAVTQDDSHKFKLALGYMETDANKLQELTDDKADTATVVPQAELLSESVERVRKQAEDVPIETLTSEREKSRAAFAKAQASLEKLEELRSEHADLQAQFERITQSLKDNIGSVAGAKDTTEPTPAASEPPINAVPLSF